MQNSFVRKLSVWMLTVLFVAIPSIGSPSSPNRPDAVSFEKDLVIENTVDQSWSEQSFISVDNTGNIFIADPMGRRVYVYSPSGTFLKEFSRKGNGPGEFERMKYFTALPDGRSVGYDFNGTSGKLIWFDQKHEHKKTTRNDAGLSMMIEKIQVSPNGDRLGARYSAFSISNGDQATQIGILDTTFKVTKIFHEDTRGSSAGVVKDWGKKVAEDVKRFYQQRAIVAFGKEGHVFVSDLKAYEIRKWNPELSKTAAIYSRNTETRRARESELKVIASHRVASLKSRLPEVVTKMFPKNLVEKTVAYLDTPPVKPSIYGIVPVSNTLLFVIRDIDAETGQNEADIFSFEGTYLGKAFLPNFGMMNLDLNATLTFGKKYAYSLQTNEEDEVSLVRYRYIVNGK